MANQSSYLKTVFSTPGTPSPLGYGSFGGSTEKVVVDPWNNKYYGDQNKNVFLSYFDNQIKTIQQNLKQGYIEQSNRSPLGYNSYSRTPLDNNTRNSLTSQLTELQQQRQDFDQNYVQKAQFFDSYNAYQNDWNKYFEGSYKNPRAEAEQQQAQKTQTEQGMARAEDEYNRQQLFAANNSLAISPPRAVGTGLSASRDTATSGLRVNGGTGLGL